MTNSYDPIEKAAAIVGQSRFDFIQQAAYHAALDVIAEKNVAGKGQKKFASLLAQTERME